jgi:hypothetical protein
MNENIGHKKMDLLQNELFCVEYEGKKYNTRKDILELPNNNKTILHINSVFENIDWTKEPTKSLKQLYKERAEQIRDMYDYLILYFSGGSDSITALNAFLDNDIPLDEVVINSFYQIDHSALSCDYAQAYLKKRMFRGKITVNMIDLNMLTEINKRNLWEHNKNFTGLVHNLSRFRIDIFEQTDLLQYTRRNGNIGHIFGADYPVVSKHNNAFYCSMRVNQLCITMFAPDLIAFFITNDMPEVHIKQCHVLARFMHKNNVYTENECKISIRDEVNDKIITLKTNGDIKGIVKPGSESSYVLNTYKNEEKFIDSYKDILKFIFPQKFSKNPPSNILKINKSFLLFEI